jgi:phytoene dehydrogenase-like protein
MTRHETIVVGGGIAGLTAGAFSARAGASTIVLEGALEPGGRARTREVQGYLFNQGPHALYLGGAARAALTALGLDPTGRAPPLQGACAVLHGVRHRFPGDGGGLLKTSLLNGVEKLALAGAYARIAGGYEAQAGESLAATFARLAPERGVRETLFMLARVASYSDAPEIADGAAILAQVRLALAGVRYLDGGWSTMIEAIAGVARRAGAQIEAGARVTAVAPDGEGWRVTRGDGCEHLADALVLAMAPDEAAALVAGDSRLAAAAQAAIPVRRLASA